MMTTRLVNKVPLLLLLLVLLFLPGCVSFLRPDLGAIARPEARIDPVRNGVLQTRDLQLDYSFTKSGNTLNLAGNIAINRSVTDSFDTLIRLSVEMNFLDDKGRVLGSVNITPLYGAYDMVPDRLPIKASAIEPPGTVAVAFNYFGELKSTGDERDGDRWEIFYYPFE